MKWLIVLVTFSSVSLAAQIDDIGVVKSADGKTAYCQSLADAHSAGYKPFISTIVPDDDGLKLNLGMSALICSLQKDGSVAWGLRKFNESLPYRNFTGATVTIENQEFVLVNRSSEILQIVPTLNETMQIFEFTVPFSSILSASEQRRLDNGEELYIRWEFFLRGNNVIRDASGVTPIGLRAGGSYYLSFSLKKSGALIEVGNLRMN